MALFAELGQGVRAVLVQPGEDVERRVSEGALWPFAAEPAVEPTDRRPYLAAETGLFGGAGLFAACICLHGSLAYLKVCL